MKKIFLTEIETDRIIEMAWEDRTPFEAIFIQFGLKEQQVIELMRLELKISSFKLWRQRVQNRASKHSKLSIGNLRFKCSQQRHITFNKMSKR